MHYHYISPIGLQKYGPRLDFGNVLKEQASKGFHLFRPQALETMAFHTDGADCYELGCIYGKLWINMPSKGISLLSVHFLMYEP
jgi:hypothetical protein